MMDRSACLNKIQSKNLSHFDSISEQKQRNTKDSIKRSVDFNSLSEILAEKASIDMPAIKEMVESLEEDSINYRFHTRTDSFGNKNLQISAYDEQKQSNFDQIIKYMKKEITKIDSLKKHEKDDQKIQHMVKNLLSNLKRIELSSIIVSNDSIEVEQKPVETKEPKNEILISPEVKVIYANPDKIPKYFNDSGKPKIDLDNLSHQNNIHTPEKALNSIQGLYLKDDELDFDKDLVDPTPNRLPPASSITSK